MYLPISTVHFERQPMERGQGRWNNGGSGSNKLPPQEIVMKI